MASIAKKESRRGRKRKNGSSKIAQAESYKEEVKTEKEHNQPMPCTSPQAAPSQPALSASEPFIPKFKVPRKVARLSSEENLQLRELCKKDSKSEKNTRATPCFTRSRAAGDKSFQEVFLFHATQGEPFDENRSINSSCPFETSESEEDNNATNETDDQSNTNQIDPPYEPMVLQENSTENVPEESQESTNSKHNAEIQEVSKNDNSEVEELKTENTETPSNDVINRKIKTEASETSNNDVSSTEEQDINMQSSSTGDDIDKEITKPELTSIIDTQESNSPKNVPYCEENENLKLTVGEKNKELGDLSSTRAQPSFSNKTVVENKNQNLTSSENPDAEANTSLNNCKDSFSSGLSQKDKILGPTENKSGSKNSGTSKLELTSCGKDVDDKANKEDICSSVIADPTKEKRNSLIPADLRHESLQTGNLQSNNSEESDVTACSIELSISDFVPEDVAEQSEFFNPYRQFEAFCNTSNNQQTGGDEPTTRMKDKATNTERITTTVPKEGATFLSGIVRALETINQRVTILRGEIEAIRCHPNVAEFYDPHNMQTKSYDKFNHQ